MSEEEIIATVTVGDVEFVGSTDEDGNPTFQVLDTSYAVAALIANGKLTLYSDPNGKLFRLCVNCNDLFAWGLADSEDVDYDEADELYSFWRRDDRFGPEVWCMKKRRELPQAPVLHQIQKEGKWNIDDLTSKYGLRQNWYDAISTEISKKQYSIYAEWARSEGNDPLPYATGWWNGWRAFTAAHPDWRNEAYEREIEELKERLKVELGY